MTSRKVPVQSPQRQKAGRKGSKNIDSNKWSDLERHLRVQAVHENEVALTVRAAGSVVICLEQFASSLGEVDVTAPAVQVSLTLPRSVQEAAWQCLHFCRRIPPCARVAAYFPDGLSTTDFIRMHDEQWNATRPPLAENDPLGRRLSVRTRQFIEARKGEDFRALAAWLALIYVAALRRTVSEGVRLISQPPTVPTGKSRAGRLAFAPVAVEIITAARSALGYMDELAGLKNIEQTDADTVYATLRFLVQQAFGGLLPAATIDDFRRRRAELNRDNIAVDGKTSSDDDELPDEPQDGDATLTFESGAFRYKGVRHPLRGKPLQVLKEIARAGGRPVTPQELREYCWEDGDAELPTIHSAVSSARKALLNAMRAAGDVGPQQPFDPIPCTDRGPELAWKLHDQLVPMTRGVTRRGRSS